MTAPAKATEPHTHHERDPPAQQQPVARAVPIEQAAVEGGVPEPTVSRSSASTAVSSTNLGPGGAGPAWLPSSSSSGDGSRGVLSQNPAETSSGSFFELGDGVAGSQPSSRSTGGLDPCGPLPTVETPMEMDKSVLEMDRPQPFTTSEPASRFATHGPGAGGGLSGAMGSLNMSQPDDFTADLDRATAGLATIAEPSTTASGRQRAATSPAEHVAAAGTGQPDSSTTPRAGSAQLPPARAVPVKKTSAIVAAREAAAESTGVDSIFRLLPRETRPAIMAMMTVDPVGRCTLSDLLEGRGKDHLRCRCGGAECGGGMNTPPNGRHGGGLTPPSGERAAPTTDDDDEADDVGDEWIKQIGCCSHPGGSRPAHEHVKIEVEEGPTKKKRMFFH